ncbi:ABC transporter permease [Carboxylicivirga sp. M1479]|uniref:ABC transporter permease n=1 Tax=Carboxylicivirga sp. M1479 TaxID=2594476 RepID=UPI0011777CFE|nr:ABC transporter permease [Carboxylicivirga sp. M1479]TRX72665.1 FtsX-like permease family protein [Carboxylicivirga sp. M1479]
MISKLITSSFRFIKRNKLFASINIIGLSLALAVTFIIVLFVINELRVNSTYMHKDRMARVIAYDTMFKSTTASTAYVLAEHLNDGFPQIEALSRTRAVRNCKLKRGGVFLKETNVYGAGSDVFKVFDRKVVGQQSGALEQMNAIALSEKYAKMLFPNADALGQEVKLSIYDVEYLFFVTAVFEDFPVNSTFKAECFINERHLLSELNQAFGVGDAHENWDFNYWDTWLLLRDNCDPKMLDAAFRAMEKLVIGDEYRFKHSLQRFSDIYLYYEDVRQLNAEGNLIQIYSLSGIAFLIMLVATLNYIILSTAISSKRAKEIGVRKTSGANTGQIRGELFFESVLLTLLALPIAVLLTSLMLPVAEKLIQHELLILESNLLLYILTYVVIVFLIGMVSGWYSAVYLSKLDVVQVLKNKATLGKRKVQSRQVLIVLQLLIFCVLASSALIIQKQYHYALTKELGFNRQNIIQIDLGRHFKHYNVFMDEVRAMPDVLSAGGSMYGLPCLGGGTFLWPHQQEKDKKVEMDGLVIDYGFIETMGLSVLNGRSLASTDTDEKSLMILNETAVHELGLDDTIGKQIEEWQVIGVVKDFHFRSVHSKIPPLAMYLAKDYYFNISVHYADGVLPSLLPRLKQLLNKLDEELPFKYSTVDDFIVEVYDEELNLSILISIAAIFTILIAVMGLFGLSLFISESQTKEIGIRKVNGASLGSIFWPILKWQFVYCIVALLASIPLTVFVMSKWLQNFAYQTDLTWWLFASSGAIAFAIVMLTVSWQTWRAARRNPVEALRYE